ncbi:hypothetical protein BGZ79_001524, partial [Entomortierella chlamydospora]
CATEEEEEEEDDIEAGDIPTKDPVEETSDCSFVNVGVTESLADIGDLGVCNGEEASEVEDT